MPLLIKIVFVFVDVMEDLYNWTNPKTNKHSPMISKQTLDIIKENAERLNSAIIYDRDFSYQYFGFKVIMESGLNKPSNAVFIKL